MNQNKLDELNRLARGTVKEKKIALTYGYQPIIDKLKKDRNTDVAHFAGAIDANVDLKLHQNNLHYDKEKASFQKVLKQAMQYMYATLIAIAIAVISIIIAVITFFIDSTATIVPYIIISFIAAIGSIVLFVLSKQTEATYYRCKQSLSKAKYLLSVAQANSQSLQAQINNEHM